MKKTLIIIIYFLSMIIHAQVVPSVTFDPVTGNYIIEYAGYEGEDQLPVIVHIIYEPTTKITPFINADIKKTTDSNNYKYTYIVNNSISSIQRLRKICVDVFSNIYEISIPNDHWRTGFYSFVPVFRWSHNIRNDGIASPMNGIAPDSSEDGFSFKSMGLPTILNSYFVGNSTIFLSFPDEPPGKISELLHPIRKFPNNTVIKLTVGPKDPPSPFIPSEFLDTLINYNTQSFELGWITDQTTRDKYLNYFNTAKTALENSDTNSAFNQLLIVLAEVDIDSSTTLSSEAYALLKYNTEYLVEQLPVPDIETMLMALISFTDQCYENGWITNRGIYNSLNKKLENAQKDWGRGNPKPAKNKLEAYRHELDAQKDKHITEDGYKFLYYYSGYLIERL